MPKTKQTPGAALSVLLKKHDLNYNRLAKAVGLSSAMIRLIARDENPVSAPVAYRLAKFFKTTPEYWLSLQMDFDASRAALDKKLAKELDGIIAVDKATFERKPKTPKAAAMAKNVKAPAKKAKAETAKDKKITAKGTAAKAPAKRGRPAAGDKPQKAVATKVAVTKVAAPKAAATKAAAPKVNKAAVVKTAAQKPVKAPAGKQSKAAVKPEPAVREAQPAVPAVQPQPAATPPESTINEPQI